MTISEVAIADCNDRINRAITYRKDGKRDYWKMPSQTVLDGFGDCEDYAVLKASQLHYSMGVPKEDINIGLCMNSEGRHAVCLVLGKRRPSLFSCFRKQENNQVWFVMDINKPTLHRLEETKLKDMDRMTYDEAMAFCQFDADIRKGDKK